MFETKFSTNNQKFDTGFNTTERSFQADFMNGGVIVGIDGASAYELAVENGFEGTVEEWLASLKGEQGPQGSKGDKGDKGDTGEQGPKGDKGDKGDAGANGKDGYTPVKGTDYFTEEDKNEIVAAVKNQLITEQWTFTLIDDTVITKDVLME